MEGLSAIAEENSAAAEEVTSSASQQVASMRTLSKASENLSRFAQELQSTVLKFKKSERLAHFFVVSHVSRVSFRPAAWTFQIQNSWFIVK